jgi:hypothetical protein
MRKIALWLVLLSGLWLAGPSFAASPTGLVTIVEGRARLLRGIGVFKLQEGVQVASGDIFEVDEGAHVQVEFADGSALGLGSKSSALLAELPSGAGKPGSVFLTSGWLKASGAGAVGNVRAATSNVVLNPKNAIFVLRSTAVGTEFFVEAGEVTPSATHKGPPLSGVRKSGDFVLLKNGAELEALKRPTPQFLAALPRMFTHTLPSRFEKIASSKREPVWESDISFADADRWLKAYPYDHQQWLVRMGGRLKDKDFRSLAEKSLAASHDWEPAIHAEKMSTKSNKP